MPEHSAAETQLRSRLTELESRRERIVQDLSQPLDADPSEQTVEMEDDTALEGQAALVEREIESVRRALARIDDGSYGQCVRCGAEIASARLAARPEAALCLECATQDGT